MSRMRWSWPELQATPRYVRRFCFDALQAEAEAAAARVEEAQRG